MSDRHAVARRLFIAVAGCAAVASAPSRSDAQAPSPDVVRLTARLHAITDTAERLKREHDAKVAAARDSLRDTVRVGPFTIAADSRYVAFARAGAESAWARLRPYYGERRITAATANAVFVVRADSVGRLVYWERFPRMSTRVGNTYEGSEEFGGLVATPAGAVEMYLGDRVRQSVDASTDRALSKWTLTPPPDPALTAVIFGNAFLQLQTAGSIPARDCSAGIVAQCLSALGLVVPLEPIEQIFTLAERRAIGWRWFEQRRGWGPTRIARANPCGGDSPDVDCERYVHTLARGAFPPPMGVETRAALVVTAIAIGGDGAMDRLLADSTVPLANRLALAAGVDRDTLLTRWRTRVLAARPLPVAPPPVVVVAALLWGVGLAGVALRLVRAG